MTYETSISFQIPEQYHASLFEALPGSCILLQNNAPLYTVLAATPEYLAQTGYRKEAIIGKGVFEMSPVNPDHSTDKGASDLMKSLAHVGIHKEPHQLTKQRYDIVGEKSSFSEKYWKASNKPVFSPGGEVAFIIHTVEDITTAVKAEKREEVHQELQIAFHDIEESEAALKQFKFMADHAQDAFILMQEDGSFSYLNKKALDAWGYTKQEAEHIRVPDADPIYNDAAYKELFAKAQEQIVPQFETLHKRKNGQTFPVEVNVNGLTLDGKPHLFAVARNIAERKKAEQALQESEARFRNMIEQAPVAITLTRGENVEIESINASMLQIMNKRSKEEVLGKKMIEVLPEVKDQAVLAIVQTVLKTGEAFYGTEVPVNLLIDEVFQTHYFNLSYTPVKEEETTSVIHVAVDVTEQVLARQKVEESERNLRNIILQAPVAICIFRGKELLIEIANEKMFEFWGKPAEAVMSKPLFEALPEAKGQGYEELMLNVLNTGESFSASELPVRLHRNGILKTVLINFAYEPLKQIDGTISGIMAIATDVTEQVLSRQNLQTALEQVRLSKEAAELGTFDLDLEMGNMHWDDRCRLLFGISHHEPVSFDLDFVKRLHPDDQQRIVQIINRAFDKSLSNGDYDVEYRTIGAEDGVERWVRAKGKVYFNSTEKPVRFIGSVLDITEQKTAFQKIENLVDERTRELAQANEALKSINKELQRSNAHLEEFAHAASHDLKEPLRKIQFFTNQLKNQQSSHLHDGGARALNRIENATERMGSLIDDLLLYSHVSQRPHEKETVDLNQKLQRVLEDLELDIEEKGAKVEISELPLVKGYPRQLQQLFQNLISNAVKYSKADVPPQISITTKEVTENGRSYYVIGVQDNGIGFQSEYNDKIFQMFTRLHGRAEYSGTGVGLSIVRKVVENHDGFIKVESTLGAGAIFNVYLPIEF